jgi:hypothetical protein
MSIYSIFSDGNNTQIEREIELDLRPGELFRGLAKATGISIWHARTALWPNGAIGEHDA